MGTGFSERQENCNSLKRPIGRGTCRKRVTYTTGGTTCGYITGRSLAERWAIGFVHGPYRRILDVGL